MKGFHRENVAQNDAMKMAVEGNFTIGYDCGASKRWALKLKYGSHVFSEFFQGNV